MFAFQMSAFPSTRHYGATNGGWTQTSLCRPCFKDYRPRTNSFLPMCTGSSSCRCHVCLRQLPSLRSLASYTVFLITNNISEFTLSSRTLYQHYVRAVELNIVPIDRLLPHSFSKLSCIFVRAKDSCFRKRFHKACVTPSQLYWYTHTEEYCATEDETIASLCTDSHEWWCDLCFKPLFATADCLFC